MKIIYFQAILTVMVLVGGGIVATKDNQPIEVRMAAAAVATGAVAWWFKSPLEAK